MSVPCIKIVEERYNGGLIRGEWSFDVSYIECASIAMNKRAEKELGFLNLPNLQSFPEALLVSFSLLESAAGPEVVQCSQCAASGGGFRRPTFGQYRQT